MENGIEQSRKTFESDERHSEVQVEGKSETVQNRSIDEHFKEPSERVDTIRHRNTSNRIE